jgi:ADP-heptose:LPS heptosyltransferase
MAAAISAETRACPDEPGEIFIIKPSSLGDVVHTLPCAARLRRAFPATRIRWLVNSEWMPLLEGNPHIDEALEFPRRKFRGLVGARHLVPWARQLRERVKAGLILDYQGLLRSALIAQLCRGSSTHIAGLGDAREGARHFYHEVVDVRECRHAVDRYLALTDAALRRYGASVPAPGAPEPLSWPLPFGAAPTGFPIQEGFIVLHPFSRGQGKSLAVEEVTAFCEVLAPRCVVLAGRGGSAVPPLENVVNLLDRTSIPELLWLLRTARMVVSVDSGPMHIAAALGVPLVSIHMWSDPERVGPYREGAWIWKDGLLRTRESGGISPGATQLATLRDLAQWTRDRGETMPVDRE